MLHNISRYIREHQLLIIIVISLVIAFAFFHEILTPFVIALIVVYLIEPLVKRMNKVKIRGHRISRGVAVLITYLVFVLAVTGLCFAFIPSLVNEISQATEQVPQFLNRVKDEDIPRWSRSIDELLYNVSFKDKQHVPDAIQKASGHVDQALQNAGKSVDELSIAGVDTSGNAPLLIKGQRAPAISELIDAAQGEAEKPVMFTFKQTGKGTYDVIPGSMPLVIQPTSNGAYTITVQESSKPIERSNFDLEKEIDKATSSLIESGTQFAGSALSVVQYTIEFVINAFVKLILVFMLAAFISIDLPKLKSNIRGLFKDDHDNAKGFDEFIERVTKGLSGVVQGQLIICCINGTLTGIGLTILGVDFSLLLGIIAGMLSIVPIFGTIISTIPAVLLGLVQGPLSAVLVLGWILLVHFCDTNFFTPKIVGSSSNLHPVIIIFSLLAGQQVAGVLGLILAVPVMSIIMTTIKFILEKSRQKQETAKPVNETLAETLAEAAALLSAAQIPPITLNGTVSPFAKTQPGVAPSQATTVEAPEPQTPAPDDSDEPDEPVAPEPS